MAPLSDLQSNPHSTFEDPPKLGVLITKRRLELATANHTPPVLLTYPLNQPVHPLTRTSILPAELLELILHSILAFRWNRYVSPRMKAAAMARGPRKVWAMHVSVFDCALGRFDVRLRREEESKRRTHLASSAHRGCWYTT